MEAKLSRPGQGATAKRTQDTCVWGLGKPHPQVSCETNRTDPPTHDREQLATRANLHIQQMRNLTYTPTADMGQRPGGSAAWECSVRHASIQCATLPAYELPRPVLSSSESSSTYLVCQQARRLQHENNITTRVRLVRHVVVSRREANVQAAPTNMEAGLCRRPYRVQLGSPTTREAH